MTNEAERLLREQVLEIREAQLCRIGDPDLTAADATSEEVLALCDAYLSRPEPSLDDAAKYAATDKALYTAEDYGCSSGETPLTDAHLEQFDGSGHYRGDERLEWLTAVDIDFARSLERRLAQREERIQLLEGSNAKWREVHGKLRDKFILAEESLRLEKCACELTEDGVVVTLCNAHTAYVEAQLEREK